MLYAYHRGWVAACLRKTAHKPTTGNTGVTVGVTKFEETQHISSTEPRHLVPREPATASLVSLQRHCETNTPPTTMQHNTASANLANAISAIVSSSQHQGAQHHVVEFRLHRRQQKQQPQILLSCHWDSQLLLIDFGGSTIKFAFVLFLRHILTPSQYQETKASPRYPRSSID
jgi:hypothetical protein